jgi:hypothetical protein
MISKAASEGIWCLPYEFLEDSWDKGELLPEINYVYEGGIPITLRQSQNGDRNEIGDSYRQSIDMEEAGEGEEGDESIMEMMNEDRAESGTGLDVSPYTDTS